MSSGTLNLVQPTNQPTNHFHHTDSDNSSTLATDGILFITNGIILFLLSSSCFNYLLCQRRMSCSNSKQYKTLKVRSHERTVSVDNVVSSDRSLTDCEPPPTYQSSMLIPTLSGIKKSICRGRALYTFGSLYFQQKRIIQNDSQYCLSVLLHRTRTQYRERVPVDHIRNPFNRFFVFPCRFQIFPENL